MVIMYVFHLKLHTKDKADQSFYGSFKPVCQSLRSSRMCNDLRDHLHPPVETITKLRRGGRHVTISDTDEVVCMNHRSSGIKAYLLCAI